jgi:hypothetical protein
MDWNNTELSRTKVYECKAKRIDICAYWDSHGKAIPWDGSKVIKYIKSKKLELYRVGHRIESDYVRPYEYEELELFIDGERLCDIGQITCFKELKTKVRLDCCVGAG